jgi:hypothetical protein
MDICANPDCDEWVDPWEDCFFEQRDTGLIYCDVCGDEFPNVKFRTKWNEDDE